MQALLDTAPPPSPAPKPGETKDGARPKAAQALTPGRERFIPVSRYGLRAKLLAMLAASGGDRKTWQRALDCLAAWRHQEHRKRLLDLIEDYQPFSPDSDTANLIELDAKGRDTARREFIASMEMLLARANFVRLSRDDVQRLLIEQSPYGLNLKVDLSEFDEALLYYRGTGVTVREERNPWRLYLAKDRLEIPIFERLFLLLKLKPDDARIAEIMATSGADRARAARSLHRARAHLPLGVSSDHIYVKMFKRIPQIDIEMLFPNTKIAFRPFDKLKLAVTAGGGTAAGVAGTATKLLAATNPFTLALALAGLSAVIFRQVMGFFNTRNRYMMLLAQNLYFCSLANNRGALTLIADGAEEGGREGGHAAVCLSRQVSVATRRAAGDQGLDHELPQGELRGRRQFRRGGRAWPLARRRSRQRRRARQLDGDRARSGPRASRQALGPAARRGYPG